MIWIIGFLTGILVLDCLILILLIMIQLPKKDAGIGQAFGGGATDALFGAGSGNALTKMTKYATVIFLVLTLGLSILHAHHKTAPSKLQQELQKLGTKAPESTAPGATVTPPLATTNPTAPVNAESPGTNAAGKAPAPAAATPSGTNASSVPAPK